jgi:hypothetical protein
LSLPSFHSLRYTSAHRCTSRTLFLLQV